MSTGIVSSTRLRAGPVGLSAAYIDVSAAPMHQPTIEISFAPLTRRVSRIAHVSSSQT